MVEVLEGCACISVTIRGTIIGKIRRGGYVFVTWKGDHSPRHVHVYRNGRLVVKFNLEARVPMKGKASNRVVNLIVLEQEGLL
jgi:hypothetical protein